MRVRNRSVARWFAVLSVLALLTTACLEEDGGGEAAPGGDEGTAGEDGAAVEGGEVSILGAFTDEGGQFRDVLAQFSEESGIDVTYEGSADFETLAVSRVEGGNPPDILLFPQPGLMAQFAERGQLQPLGDIFDPAELEERLLAGLIDLGMVNGELFAVPIWISVKSLVWYPKDDFDAAGYQVPETWEELEALTQQIREDGTTPWCVGIESGAATGWVVTDWIEDIMLRTAGPEAYDQWVAGELPFTSEEVQRAGELFSDLVLTEGNTLGGRTSILSTPFGDAPAPMFEDPPACFLHRQASFIVGSFPEDAEFGTDYDVFVLPPAPGIGDFEGLPILGAGDIMSLATENPAAEEVMQFLTTPGSFEQSRAQEGGTLFAFREFEAEQYPQEVDQAVAEILAQAETFRFDASDLMPGEVGAGAFWTQMVDWINQETELQEALENIDDAWPEVAEQAEPTEEPAGPTEEATS